MKHIVILLCLSVTCLGLCQDTVPVAPGSVGNAALEAKLKELAGNRTIRNILPDMFQDVPTEQVGARLPQSVEDLPFEDVRIKLISSELAIQLGFLSAKLSYEKFDWVLVESWEKYMPLTIDGKAVRYGLSMQLVVKVKGSGLNADLGSIIRSLSARGGFSRFEAAIEMNIIGFSSPSVTAAMPAASLLTTKDNLRDLSTAFIEVKKMIWSTISDQRDGFRPQIIAVQPDSPAAPTSTPH